MYCENKFTSFKSLNTPKFWSKKNNEVLRGQQRQCRGELILNNMKKLEEMLADYYYCNQNFFFVFRFLQSCRCVSTSHLRQREGILILLLFLFRKLNFVKVLSRFVRLLLTSKGKNIFIKNMKCIKLN